MHCIPQLMLRHAGTLPRMIVVVELKKNVRLFELIGPMILCDSREGPIRVR